MCDTCGCTITPGNEHLIRGDGRLAKGADGKAAVELLQGLLGENDHQAGHNRDHFDAHRVLAINLMSSPGSGKTALLEATARRVGERFRIAVVEGDLETENDAARIRAQGVPAIQIQTGSACHLDAHMVHDALHELGLDGVDILFIENVGNLVCPASFDLGHHLNVTLLSVTEGDDKPAKYPVMFRGADLVLLTKSDLLAVLDDFDPHQAEERIRALANAAPVITLSSRRDADVDRWLDWLDAELAAHRARLDAGERRNPTMQPDGFKLHHHDPPHDHDHGHGHRHHAHDHSRHHEEG